jgi:hypothetical protein
VAGADLRFAILGPLKAFRHVLSLADRRAEASAAVAEAVRRFSAKGNTAAVKRAMKAAAERLALVD